MSTHAVARESAFGTSLRRFRQERRLSQEALSDDAEVSTRHLSCLESGKAQPSREMVLILGSALDLPLRDRNRLLAAAGFTAAYRETPLDSIDDGPLGLVVTRLLAQHEPFGAVALDRLGRMLRLNAGAARILGLFAPPDLPPELAGHLIHATLHPLGLRTVLVNWEEVAAALLARLQREVAAHPTDVERTSLFEAVSAYPGLPRPPAAHRLSDPQPFLALHLKRADHELRLFTVLTSIGTPLDVTAQDLSIETWFPADDETEQKLRTLATHA